MDEAEKGLYFGQKESSDGEAVSGIYRVALPDGRLQTVKYTADDTNGYVATVTYEHGPAYVPVSYPAPAPTHAPAPAPTHAPAPTPALYTVPFYNYYTGKYESLRK